MRCSAGWSSLSEPFVTGASHHSFLWLGRLATVVLPANRVQTHMSDHYTSYERVWLRTGFEFRCLTGTVVGNTKRFESQAASIVRTANQCDYDLLGRTTEIPRLMGMRDASRNWTAFMVIEHLRRYNEFLLKAMQSLIIDDESRIVTPEFRYLVPEDVGADCIEEFQESAWQYAGFINNLSESGRFPRSTGSIRHPFFGKMDARRIHCFSGFHLSIHRRQIQKILAIEGVV